MRKCAQLGCLAGGAVVQVVGAEMTPDSWRWVFARSGPPLFQNGPIPIRQIEWPPGSSFNAIVIIT